MRKTPLFQGVRLGAGALLLTLASSASAQMIATSPDLGDEEPREFRRVQLCGSWSYDSQSGGYLCRFTSYEDLVDQWDIQALERTISQLERTVQDLERRVSALETR